MVYATVITKTKYEWNRLLNFSGKYIYRNDGQPTEYNRICNETINETIVGYIIKMMVIMMSFVVAVTGPFYSFVQDGKLETLYSLKLPYFNRNPYMEFIINVIWQFLITLIGGCALFCMEGTIMLLNNAIIVSSKLCHLELIELSKYLEEFHENENRRDTKFRLRLTMVYMKILYMDEYDEKRLKMIFLLNTILFY